MLRQYSPQRHRYERVGNIDRAIGTIPVGKVFRLNSCFRPRTLIVEAWLPRRIGAGRRVDGRYADTFVARGGHLAQVRDLATGRPSLLADHLILHAVEQA